MNQMNKCIIEHLGQTGLKIDVDNLTVLVDPYLSNSVQELDASDLVRQVPIPYAPNEMSSIDWILITHEHIDHCDPHTIPIIAKASPQCCFTGPLAVRRQLYQWGIEKHRIFPLPTQDTELGNSLSVYSVPAAHPTVRWDADGSPKAVGYVFNFQKRIMYVAGDTSVCDEIILALKSIPRIDVALLPVNEDNYFRRRRGIVGNMSVREAFELARELRIKEVVPVHWDMFECNSTSQDEILGVYNSSTWPFSLGSVNSIKL